MATYKNVTTEQIVVNLKEFTDQLHAHSREAMLDSLLEKEVDMFVLSKLTHDISHALIDIMRGATADEALSKVFEDEDEENSSFVGQIAVNVKTGEAHGIEDIKDPELKAKIAEIVQGLADKLGSE